jgi:hypothetical protein
VEDGQFGAGGTIFWNLILETVVWWIEDKTYLKGAFVKYTDGVKMLWRKLSFLDAILSWVGNPRQTALLYGFIGEVRLWVSLKGGSIIKIKLFIMISNQAGKNDGAAYSLMN